MSRILIVDDDEQLGRSLQRLLGRDGHQVAFAENIDGASGLSQGFDPELILIELAPADIDRLSALRDRTTRSALGPVPIIFMSGDPATLGEIAAIAAPTDDRIAKPCDPSELIARVSAALARGGSVHE